MSVQIDWTKVPREIDGKMTRWVAMDGDETFCVYVVNPKIEDINAIWDAKEGEYTKIPKRITQGWHNNTPWHKTLTPTP